MLAPDRRCLRVRLDGLLVAVAQYVEAISGQTGERLTVLLARRGLNGQNPTTGGEAARRLGVSCQRVYQLERQLSNHLTRAAPPAWGWMPQVTRVRRTWWPDSYSDAGIATITEFVSPH